MFIEKKRFKYLAVRKKMPTFAPAKQNCNQHGARSSVG